jgi:RNA polymerase sigma-70 factor (ECF subfamily)
MNEMARPTLRLVETAPETALRAQVEAAVGRDSEAFRELFERYSPSLFRYACARLVDRGLAEDAVQSVFVVAWTRLDEFRYETDGAFVAWLFAIARRVMKEQVRRERKHIATPMDAMDPAVPGFEQAVLDRASVVDALRRLPDGQREVLVLRFIVGLTRTEVALAMGKSESRVKELQHRGLARLRRTDARGDLG